MNMTRTKTLAEAFPEAMKNVGDILLLAKLLTPEDPAIPHLDKLLENARTALSYGDTVGMVSLYYQMQDVLAAVNPLCGGEA
jgi:hypothetical protein